MTWEGAFDIFFMIFEHYEGFLFSHDLHSVFYLQIFSNGLGFGIDIVIQIFIRRFVVLGDVFSEQFVILVLFQQVEIPSFIGEDEQFLGVLYLFHIIAKGGLELVGHFFEYDVSDQPDQAYYKTTKQCNLCLTEKLSIINIDKTTTLNKRSELVSKCRHKNSCLMIA